MAAVASYLVDSSASARAHHPTVGERIEPLIESGLAATCGALDFEHLFSARTAEDYEHKRARRRRSYEYLPTEDRHWELALEAQRFLAGSGRHRAIGLPDLLIAAVAADNRVRLLHYDADFELAAEVMDLDADWVVAPGSVP